MVMRAKTRKVLPKILIATTRGKIYKQDVKCGKKNCKCARGETHTAYYYFYRSYGLLTKYYIRKAELAEFREAVETRNYMRKRGRDITKQTKIYLKKRREQDKFYRQLGIKENPVEQFWQRFREIFQIFSYEEFQERVELINEIAAQKRRD